MFGMVPRRKEAEERWPVANPLAVLPNEFRALYHRLFGDMPLLRELDTERLWNIEMMEGEKEVVVRMEVPGFELEDFHLDLRGNRLIVKAEHAEPEEAKTEKAEGEKKFRRYERVLLLPEGLAPEKAEAGYHSGVLEIRLPRNEEAVGRRIPVHG